MAHARKQKTSGDVLVVGAGGAAGVFAMRKLRDLGMSVIGLEAAQRLGGRIRSVLLKRLAGYPLELGAEFAHGDEMRTRVEQFGLTPIPHPSEQGMAYIDGEFRSLGAVLALVSQFRNDALSALARGCEDMNVEEFFERHPRTQQILNQVGITRHFLFQLIHNDHAAPVSQLGISGWIEPDIDGFSNNYRIKEGFSKLIERASEGLDIRLQHRVRVIRWNPGSVEVETNRGTFMGNRAIIALPIGVLQQHPDHGGIHFDGVLPREKLRAIDAIQAGTATKMILGFSCTKRGNTFWPLGVPLVATTLASQLWWPSGWGQSEGRHFLLTGLVAGNAVERFDDPEFRDAALAQLAHMYGTDIRRYARHACLRVSWHKEPFIRTGYSWLSAGTDPLVRDDLAAPVDQTLYFAGEAVGDPQKPGAVASVHGAIASGEWSAKALHADST